MLQSTLPASWHLVFNPDASGLSAIERATVLKLYGGIAFSTPSGAVVGAAPGDTIFIRKDTRDTVTVR